MHRIQAGAVTIGHDPGHPEAVRGVEIPGVLAGAQSQAAHPKRVRTFRPRLRQGIAQALAVQRPVDHAPAEGRGVRVDPHQAAARDDPAMALDDEIVALALGVQQVAVKVRAFVGAEVARHVAVEQGQASAGIGGIERAQECHEVMWRGKGVNDAGEPVGQLPGRGECVGACAPPQAMPGNRTSITTSTGTADYIYPANSHRLMSVDGEARSYDAAGNTTSVGSRAFSYNDANGVHRVKRRSVLVESYGYNHRGERVLRIPVAGELQITLYDEAGQWIGNYGGDGQAQQQAIWLDNYPIAVMNAPSAGVPDLACIQPDHLGTPRVVIDPLRDVAIWNWSSQSEAFGNRGPANDPDGDGAVFDLSLRFPGQQATAASGLLYDYKREYDPVAGRYSQSDPIGLMGGVSTFCYVGGNPISLIDLLGMAGKPVDLGDGFVGRVDAFN
ncbi:putative deoxyribonuclease RhsC [compost metagenome]